MCVVHVCVFQHEMDADAIARLKELSALKADGVLTDAEFAEQKAAIIASKTATAAKNVAEGVQVEAVHVTQPPLVALADPREQERRDKQEREEKLERQERQERQDRQERQEREDRRDSMERQKMNTPIAPVAAAPTIINNNNVVGGGGGGTTVVVNADNTVNHCQHCEPALARALKHPSIYPRAPALPNRPASFSLMFSCKTSHVLCVPRVCSLLLLLDRWAHASVLDRSVLLRLLPEAVRLLENLALFTPSLLLPPVHPPLGRDKTGGLHRTRVEGGTYGRREVMDGVAMTLAILPDVSSCVACGRSGTT